MVSALIREEQELEDIARTVLEVLSRSHTHVVTLKGDLGAGKTAFTKALARVLGIDIPITSPTFVIMKSYEVRNNARFTRLTHLDAYRIEDEEELKVLRLNEVLGDTTQLVVIEWPEKIQNSIPPDVFHMTIDIEENNARRITYDE